MRHPSQGDDLDAPLEERRPVRARLIGSQFCEVDGPIKLSTTGSDCVRRAATLLLREGINPETPMVLHTSVGAASTLRGTFENE
jgi:hypothetical protein